MTTNVVGAFDASIKGHNMGGYQKITNKEEQQIVENRLFSKEQIHNIPRVGEVTILLDLVVIIK